MMQSIACVNTFDENGNPSGGSVIGVGLDILWQNGPLGRRADRVIPNGAFCDTVLEAVKQRLEFYQGSKFKCDENALAIKHIEDAITALAVRTANREERKVEGTHEV